jgi:hypothetical protein
MGIIVNDGNSKPVNLTDYAVDFQKAKSVKSGDMVSWQSSGGSAQGKVVRVVSSGKINVPDSSFTISGTEDDPAVLIQLYRDGKPTETKVGHKMSTLRKSVLVEKHGSHDQGSHGAWANGKFNPDDSEGEDEIEPKNYRTPQKLSDLKDDSEGEFEDLNYDDPRRMDDMDLRPFGGAAFAKTWGKPIAVAKHGGGSHDQESHGSWAGNGAGGLDSGTQGMLDRGKKALEGKDLKAMLRDYDKMETKWRKKLNAKPYDPENEEYGDPQDLAQAEFQEKYGASLMDVEMFGGAL